MYLKDIADVQFGFKDRESYARLNGLPVISLNVIKKGGENLVEAGNQKMLQARQDYQASAFSAGTANTPKQVAEEAKRLKDLEKENARLKNLVADAKLDKAMLKELLEGKW